MKTEKVTKEFYLVQNLMYNCSHIKKKTWWNILFGPPSLTKSVCEAESEFEAETIFLKRGYHFGILHEYKLMVRGLK